MYNDNILVLTYEGFSSCCPVCNWSCCQPLCQFCWLVCGLTGGKYVFLLGCVVSLCHFTAVVVGTLDMIYPPTNVIITRGPILAPRSCDCPRDVWPSCRLEQDEQLQLSWTSSPIVGWHQDHTTTTPRWGYSQASLPHLGHAAWLASIRSITAKLGGGGGRK